jgi:alcohol dehydrogenase class IV
VDDLTNEHSLAARSSSKQLQCLDSLDSPQGGGVSTVVLGAQTFLFGTGASGKALAGALTNIGTSRVAIVCNRSVADAGLVGMLTEQALRAATVVAQLDSIGAGVPEHEVEKVAAQWRPLGIDTLVAIGGGSAIDTAKALCILLGGIGSELSDFFVRPGEVRTYPGGEFPTVVAVPTTLSGAEVTASAGISTGSEKRLIRVEQIAPRIVCADPANLLPTPPRLLASTGFCALAHGVEAVYSMKRNPVSTALAFRSAALLGAGLGELSAQARADGQAPRDRSDPGRTGAEGLQFGAPARDLPGARRYGRIAARRRTLDHASVGAALQPPEFSSGAGVFRCGRRCVLGRG